MAPASPRIADSEWGRLEIEGEGTFKDVKLWPGGARAWDWNETGTRHRPGVQPADLQELLDNGSAEIIIGQGMLGRLQVAPETLAWLSRCGIPLTVLPTEEAIAEYNRRVSTVPVGALIHSTC